MHSHLWNWRIPSFLHFTWGTQNLKRKLEDGSKIWSPFSTIWSLSSLFLSRVQFFETPWTTAHQASLSITNSWSLLKLMSIESVMPFNYLTVCHLFLLLPSILPSVRIFSNESALCIRWPNYWSFSFNISPSNEYSALISFMISCKVHSEPFHGYCRQIERRVQVSHFGILEAVTLQMNVKMGKKKKEINLCASSSKCLSPYV